VPHGRAAAALVVDTEVEEERYPPARQAGTPAELDLFVAAVESLVEEADQLKHPGAHGLALLNAFLPRRHRPETTSLIERFQYPK
jgi:hypothetical protein